MGYDTQLRVKPDIIKGCVVVDNLTELLIRRVYQVSGLHTYDPFGAYRNRIVLPQTPRYWCTGSSASEKTP